MIKLPADYFVSKISLTCLDESTWPGRIKDDDRFYLSSLIYKKKWIDFHIIQAKNAISDSSSIYYEIFIFLKIDGKITYLLMKIYVFSQVLFIS